jgi:hypothetical protein
MDAWEWLMVDGQWVIGEWLMDDGKWSMVYG